MDCSQEYKGVYLTASYNEEKEHFEGVISVDGRRIEAENYAQFIRQFEDYVNDYIYQKYKEYKAKDKKIFDLEEENKFLKKKLDNIRIEIFKKAE